jgi:aspyridone synthetase, hybrid polyketide synthase / nonribosomal peptide synthetase
MKEPIAIVGSACRFPGGASSTSKLWDLLRDPKDVLSDFPSSRLNLTSFYNANGEHHGSTDVKNKSYLLSEDHRLFDASFFNVNPLEADGMDPQQRILMETVYEALESAGYTLEQIQGSLTSVFVGLMTADYYDIQLRDLETLPRYNATGTARSILSNRISYFFDLKGPSMTIDTACSSSMVALHEAVQSLRNGDSETAIVAGANLLLDPSMYVAESTLHMLSPSSRSRMWDKSADGYARGEGFAALFLKSLSRALEDGDDIECVVKETAVNSDGRTKGITMPSSSAQAALIRQTYRNAGLDTLVDRPQMFECHGTGTLAGDPIEAQAIKDAFFPDAANLASEPRQDTKLFVGSIKTVIGHLEGCAGLAGLLKASLAMKHRTIPPNMHFNELNPAVAPFYGNLQIPTEAMPWPRVTASPLRASVNSFGFGGTNAHAILESYGREPDAKSQSTPIIRHGLEEKFVGPLILSANSQSSLLASIQELSTYIKRNPSVDLTDLTWVLQARRTPFPIKTFFSGATRVELLRYMDKAVEDAQKSGDSVGTPPQFKAPNEVPGILGIFTGQGAQWATMGRELTSSCRLFRESIERCESCLASLPDPPEWSLIQELMADKASSRLSEAAISQPLCTALQIAMVDLCTAARIKFDAVVGHSSGEIAATYAAGIISSTDAIRIAYYRGLHAKLAQGAGGKSGAMMAVGMSLESARSFCTSGSFLGRIGVAASNSPSSVTLSGDSDSIKEAKEILDQEKTFARLLPVDTAYHSTHMHACAQPYLDSLKPCDIQVNPPRNGCIWVSSVRGDTELLEGDLQTLTGQYWVDNMVNPVLFSQAVECSLWTAGPFDMVVELGPHPALKGPATQTFKSALGSSLPYAGFMRRGDNEVEAFSGGVGYLWSYLGPSFVDFDDYRRAYQELGSKEPKMLKNLPSYVWDHERIYWKESRISRKFRLRDHQAHEILGRRVADDSEHEMRWRNILRLSELPWLRGHEFQGQALFPFAGYISMAMEAAKVMAEGRPIKMIELEDMAVPRALVIDEERADVETVFTVRRTNTELRDHDNRIMQAEFTCYFCSDETAGTLEKSCGGRLLIRLGHSSVSDLPPRTSGRSNLTAVNMKRFYPSLVRLGLNYQGLFKPKTSARRTENYATGSASWLEIDLGQNYLLHPAFLDVGFHSIFAAFASHESDALWTPYLPVYIRRLTVNPNLDYRSHIGEIEFENETFITKSSSSLIEGDIHYFDPDGNSGIQIEGLTLKSFMEPKASNDRLIFSETIWDSDIFGGYADLQEDEPEPEELQLVDAIERTVLYYFQAASSKITTQEVKQLEWHFQRMYETFKDNIALIRNDQHSTAKKEWLDDGQEYILSLREKFAGRVDLEMVHAIGENLTSILRGETQLLEIMLENDMLNRFYMESRLFAPLNKYITKVVKKLTHKYPRLNVLEIGAGTGGTTKSVLDSIGNTYSSWTYTDISSGFFEKAAKKFADHSGKLTFKVLDIEKDVSEQGYREQSYDVVIAANVLHATHKLTETMRHTRSLLKPGGYLVLMEVTGDTMAMPFVMGGLPGWWLGVDEGRRHGPGVSPVKWDELLQATGFSGVDKVVYDLPDAIKHSCSTIVTQAVNESFNLIRDPIPSLDLIPVEKRLLIVGGRTLPVARLVNDTQRLLSLWKDHITIAKSVDDMDRRCLGPGTSIICLTELDRPMFSDPVTAERLTALQDLFRNAKNVLWITSGRNSESPYSNMSVGMGRAFMFELPHITLQFMDIGKAVALGARRIVEAFLRLTLSSSPEHASQDMLWVTEPEVAFDGDVLLIPRILLNETLNKRFNATRRRITKEVVSNRIPVEIISCDGFLSLQETSLSHANPPEDTNIHVKYSVALPSKDDDRLFLCLGVIQATEKIALALSRANCSVIAASSDEIVILAQQEDCSSNMLRVVASQLIASTLLSAVPIDCSTLIYEAEEMLGQSLMQAADRKGQKIFFATSQVATTPKRYIRIHPQASALAISSKLPRGLTSFIDCSDSGNNRIKSCLPSTCSVRTLQSYLFSQEMLSSSSHKLLVEAYAQAMAYWPQQEQSTIEQSVLAQDLEGASHASSLYPNVVDWSCSTGLTVTIKPLCPSGLFSTEKTYFMVGMASELGQSICGWMVKNGARYIALTSRSAKVDPLWLEEMEELGAIVIVHKMDVTDRNSVRSVHAMICNTMPPIAGVCNAAMVLYDSLFLDMNADTMNDVLRPKVDGSKHLNELFTEPTLDFFILFGSYGSLVGHGGQANYHAANLFMSSLAAQRREKGLAASAMGIGLVVDIGYTARAGEALIDRLLRNFYSPLSMPDVHQLFAEAVLASPPNARRDAEILMGIEPFILSADTQRKPPWFPNPRFSHFIREADVSNGLQQTAANALHIRQQLDSAASEEIAMDALQAAFSAKLESMLQLPSNSLNLDVPLLDLGADSLLAVEIRTWFLNEITVDVPILKILSGDTVAEICRDATGKYLTSRMERAQVSATEVSIQYGSGAADNNNETTSARSISGQDSEQDNPNLSESKLESGTSESSFPSFSDDLGSPPSLQKGIDPTYCKKFKRLEKLSHAQARIWFMSKYIKDPTAYNIVVSYDVKGSLHVPRFKHALAAVISRHESLRTYFFAKTGSGELMQGVLTTPSNCLKHIQRMDGEEVKREFDELKRRIWNLEEGDTFQATLVSEESGLNTIVFAYHHIVMDGVSWHLFLRDLSLAYQMTALKPLSKQYADFSLEQVSSVEKGDFEDQIDFWKREHAQLPVVMPLLPFARVKARKTTDSYESHTTVKEIGFELAAKIKRASQNLRVTPFHFQLAAMQVLFSRLLDVEDLCIGVTDANRADKDYGDTIGFFLNMMALRFQVRKGDRFSELVKHTSNKVFAALRNSAVPFDLVSDRLNVPRSSAHSPLFQVAFNYRMGDMIEIALGDCQLECTATLEAKSQYDLAFNVTQTSTGNCYLQITSHDYLYTPEVSNLLANMYKCVLDSVVTDTSLQLHDCPLFEDTLAQQAIHIGRGPRVSYDWPATLCDKFDDIRRDFGNDVAVKSNLGAVSYKELARHMNQIATALLDRGSTAGSRIVVLCEPSADTIASMLAILRVGCIYVPVDMSLPQARQAAIVENCKPTLILCQPATVDLARAFSVARNRIINIAELSGTDGKVVASLSPPTSPAFLLYTSGSTGTPKGILLSQAGFINYLASKASRLSLGREVVMQQSSTGFDMSIAQIFNALGNGGVLVIVPLSARGDPVEISKLMLREQVTFTIGTPSEYVLILRYGSEYLNQYSSWRHACLGGEAVSEQMKRAFRQLDRSSPTITDCYGPTEISAATAFETVSLSSRRLLISSDYSSVGKAIPNSSIYIVDGKCNPVPAGFPGEICIGGVGIALGYLDLPELNNTKFVSNPFATPEDLANGWTRMYKTGDQGLLAQDGSLIFMGRKDGDTQIKLRGLRIDLDDVANTLLQTAPELLSDAVVSVRGDPQFLVAHIVPRIGQSISEADLQLLTKKLPLPQYMCPAITIPLDRLPTSPNGKLDRKAIEALPLPIQTFESKTQGILTLPEGELRLIWEDVLPQTALALLLSSESDFFMVGGNSLLLVKLQGAIKETMGVSLSLKELYQNSTLAKMATLVTAEKEQQDPEKPIDWDSETALPESLIVHPRQSQTQRQTKDRDREVLLTGSTTFLGSAILASLVESPNVSKIHCVAVAAEQEKGLPKSQKVIVYHGSLIEPTLGLSKDEYMAIQSCINVIIHVGANGHCLNNYSSLRIPNFFSTRFLATLAIPYRVPLHFYSSNRVTLLSGSSALSPVSVSSFPPATDGSEGYTATKWASERFLEELAMHTGLEVCVHRSCAVIGEQAPSEDALNALLRYSLLMRAVPQPENVDGFFDFRDVHAVGAAIVREALVTTDWDQLTSSPLRIRHHSSGTKVPVQEFRHHMERAQGCRFEELSMSEWCNRARGLGIEPLIVSYLNELVSLGKTITFPYMGEVEA